jgi:hypothetical protein
VNYDLNRLTAQPSRPADPTVTGILTPLTCGPEGSLAPSPEIFDINFNLMYPTVVYSSFYRASKQISARKISAFATSVIVPRSFRYTFASFDLVLNLDRRASIQEQAPIHKQISRTSKQEDDEIHSSPGGFPQRMGRYVRL